MDEVMKEYKTCPECNHPWVSSHFQGGVPCLCVECGCSWAITIKAFHDLANDMIDREGKPLEVKAVPIEVKPVPMLERVGIEEKARKPVITDRFWVWFILGILILLMWVRLTRKDEGRLSVEQTIEERDKMELIEEVIHLIEEGRCDEIPELIP